VSWGTGTDQLMTLDAVRVWPSGLPPPAVPSATSRSVCP